MKDLTKIEKPFGLLSKKTQKRLKAHGGPYEQFLGYDGWVRVDPTWAEVSIYRVKPPEVAATKPSIDWSHVAEGFDWLAEDANGDVCLYPDKPELGEAVWLSDGWHHSAGAISSLDPGTCDWKDSLVQRPAGDRRGL